MNDIDNIQKSHDTINEALANSKNSDQSLLSPLHSDNGGAYKEALVFIHKIIKYFKPKNILEFGVGSSTLTIADAVKKSNLKTNLNQITRVLRIIGFTYTIASAFSSSQNKKDPA